MKDKGLKAVMREDAKGLDWNTVIKGRRLAASLPHILKLPVIKSVHDLIPRYLKKGDSLLDIGANDRHIKTLLERNGIDIKYFSLDIDQSFKHDYNDIKAVDRRFNMLLAIEVIEHIDPAVAMELFRSAFGMLEKDGVFLISTPNVCHPVVFWRDCTHITPFRYDELYGLLASAGFGDIEVFRIGSTRLKDRLLALYYRPLLRLMRMDFASGIAAAARKR